MKKTLKNIIFSLIIPMGLFVILKVLSVLLGDGGFAVGSDISTIIYTGIYTCMIALALGINILSGRIDFSIGSVLVVSAIIGGNIAKNHNFGAMGLIITVLLVGMIAGLISGIIYITLKLPPMITSLGVTMIYEAISQLYNQSKGIKMIGRFDVLVFAGKIQMWIILALVIGVLTYMISFTRFGYNYSALSKGQKISIETGINEKINALICYVIAGGLMGLAATIYLSRYGTVSPQAGLTSSSYFMGAFLPIFLGSFIGKYSNVVIGIMIGSFTQAMLSSGLVDLGLSNSIQTVLSGVFTMLFLVFTTNYYKVELKRLYREKLKRALSEVQV